MAESLSDWRERIDSLDAQLVKLLNERYVCSLAIGRYKKEHGLPVLDPQREAELLEKVCSFNPGPLPREGLERIYDVLFAESRRLQENLG